MTFWFLSRPSNFVAEVVRGSQDHSHEWFKGRTSLFDTMEASQPNIVCHYQLQQRAMPFWFLSRTSNFVAEVVRGSQDHSHEWVKGRTSPFDAMKASQPNIGYHYQLKQRDMTFGSFHDLPKSSLGWCEVAKSTAMSGSRVAHHHSTLWKQANRILYVTTSYKREP
jgi:hypothetical protein